MRRLAIAASIAALTLFGGVASAATSVKYTFTGESVTTRTDTDGTFVGSFTAMLPDLVSTPLVIEGANLLNCNMSFNGVSSQCFQIYLKPSGYGDYLDLDQVEFWYRPTGVSEEECTGSTGCRHYQYQFAAHALATPGPYLTLLRDDDDLGQAGLFASDLGALTVGYVPEPATWALMIGGFGVVGASLRARRRRAALV